MSSKASHSYKNIDDCLTVSKKNIRDTLFYAYNPFISLQNQGLYFIETSSKVAGALSRERQHSKLNLLRALKCLLFLCVSSYRAVQRLRIWQYNVTFSRTSQLYYRDRSSRSFNAKLIKLFTWGIINCLTIFPTTLGSNFRLNTGLPRSREPTEGTGWVFSQ